MNKLSAKMDLLKPLYYLMLILIVMSVSSSCRTQGSRVKKQQKAIEKRKEEKLRQQQQVYNKTLENHKNIQGEQGKQRLLEAEKHKKALNKSIGKNQSFFRRLFSKKSAGCN
jgi:hypothetical protein